MVDVEVAIYRDSGLGVSVSPTLLVRAPPPTLYATGPSVTELSLLVL